MTNLISERAVAEISLDAAAFNMVNIRKKVGPKTKIMAIVKADAYGHGAIMFADSCLENGADCLGVATLDEGIELRNAGFDCDILLLGFTPIHKMGIAVEYNLTQTLYNYHMAEACNEAAKNQNKTHPVHIKIDSGMSRLGFLPTDESIDVIKRINQMKNIKIGGAFTHFATADSFDKYFALKQKNVFIEFINKVEASGVIIPVKHVSNSAAEIDMEDFNLDMIRPGIMLYGLWPSSQSNKEKINLRPVMTLKSCLSNVKTLPAGETIGYGRTYTLLKKTIVGTIPMGYADGISRNLSNKGRVLVGGQYVNIIGTVCMDQFMVDLTDISDVKQGDEAVLFGDMGNHSISADEIASLRGTIHYEVVCNIARRVPRIYIKNGKVISEVNYLT